ncbi:DUF5906 domain-containing protein [Vibrio breoganii]|uniref:DUF5906 domain-containing protein n=1 Tax=Vibrio breoganii TaxID=553239 RepID=UPI000C85BFF0|nr:DUF5906 domain-containing protein [Vibrio breoganii]PMG98925.1 hypothetical protein BCU80_03215 [Vibrio breoganii]PMK34085.1 hypothetical protein BCU06_00380 [Vibrio breoganii]PML54570.1 hypothetical protein BCT73_15475 [Vibrio breoganii]PMO81352.1 hypothetical protein BCT00_11685 [Vibrio breoganii]
MAKTARRNDEQYRYEKALADAICHDMPISYGDAERINLSLISDDKHKRIISTFKDLYQEPTSQPTNKQIADDIHTSMLQAGYSAPDADKEADDIEELVGRKRQPNISLIADAIGFFTTDTTKPTYLHLVSDQESPVAYDSLLDLCKNAEGESLEDASDSVVGLFNSSHSVVLHGSKTLVCERVSDHKDNISYVFSQVHQKRAFYANLNFPYMAEDKIKHANCFDLWMKAHARKTYHGVVFDPANRANGRFLNMWQGFAVDPVEGDDQLDTIMWHLLHVVCDGNQEHFGYLLAWMAHIVQKPQEKSGVCLVLKSEARGTGKSTVSILMEKLLGQHSMRVQDSKHLLGEFNSHLANKLFITVEEAFWGGSKKDAGKFRSLITEGTITVEAKGKDAIEVDSYHRFMLCTNNDWAVPQTADERRFFTLEVSDQKKQDKEYFSTLYRDINSPNTMGQLFNFLQSYDTTPYNLSKAPMTKATQQQVMESLPPEGEWAQSLIENGSILDGNVEFDLDTAQNIPKRTFFNDYIDYCEKMKVQGYDRCSDKKLGVYLKKVFGFSNGAKVSINGNRAMCYRTTPLDEMNRSFEEYYQYS